MPTGASCESLPILWPVRDVVFPFPPTRPPKPFVALSFQLQRHLTFSAIPHPQHLVRAVVLSIPPRAHFASAADLLLWNPRLLATSPFLPRIPIVSFELLPHSSPRTFVVLTFPLRKLFAFVLVPFPFSPALVAPPPSFRQSPRRAVSVSPANRPPILPMISDYRTFQLRKRLSFLAIPFPTLLQLLPAPLALHRKHPASFAVRLAIPPQRQFGVVPIRRRLPCDVVQFPWQLVLPLQGAFPSIHSCGLSILGPVFLVCS
mmetsp:Transcript_19903/g.48863  ORF Transcript_19903/g.48863 Transcript_19903/m.48863 type:complete len:260 (-) Transcript_19903:3025-3804(-)